MHQANVDACTVLWRGAWEAPAVGARAGSELVAHAVPAAVPCVPEALPGALQDGPRSHMSPALLPTQNAHYY